MRVGIGYDIHRLAGGRPFLLGGVVIQAPHGPVGHSDGDVLLHAIIDALLGAAGLGDIGRHFPPGDPQWRDVASARLLERTLKLVHQGQFEPYNVDVTIVLERPKLAPYMATMTAALAKVMGLPVERVNLKAKTNEGLDALGQGRAVAAHAVVLLREASGRAD
ncbi:MAG: 2-C-methyl-D-erythritol 2,4-cyclodiphosphate synthase [Chloroflexi bacterium]|nr:2-C-methyl-D-erythritol 2,4-cyclodiphosphate synthase [Chloroflexota bacterium]